MIKDKKGIAFQNLAEIMLILVVGMVLLIVAVNFGLFVKEESFVDKCRLSVLANAKVNEVTLGNLVSDRNVAIDCPAEKVVIEQKPEIDQAREINEMLRSCWYKMGEGDINVFGNEIAENIIGKSSICLICSEFVSNDVLPNTLLNQQINQKIPGKDLTYDEYLDSSNGAYFCEYNNGKFECDKDIKKQSEYVVFFVRQQANTFLNLFGDEQPQVVMVLPEEDLARSKVCDKLFWQRAVS